MTPKEVSEILGRIDEKLTFLTEELSKAKNDIDILKEWKSKAIGAYLATTAIFGGALVIVGILVSYTHK